MSSFSRTYARASRRGKRLMKQYQGPGVYQRGEIQHRDERLARISRRIARNDEGRTNQAGG